MLCGRGRHHVASCLAISPRPPPLSSPQVRLSLERHREELQRHVASLDSQLAVSHARLDDAAAEATSLNQVSARRRQHFDGKDLSRCHQPQPGKLCFASKHHLPALLCLHSGSAPPHLYHARRMT